MRNLETKQEIRKQIRKIRNCIEPEVWQRATDIITEKVIQSDCFRETTDLLCYINFEGEVGTHEIIEEAWRLGKNVWVPKVAGNDMDFYCIHSFDELKKGTFGVPEPSDDGEPFHDEEALMIVPGVAFDRKKNRIGYGKGYYDRYLMRNPEIETIGISFDLQMMESLPAEETDRPLCKVFTETLEI